MSEETSLPKRIVSSLDEEVRTQLRLASAIAHPGESGRARENIIAAFVRKLVPAGFGVDTGFVVDSQGGISRQVDIVIYRTGYHPVFDIGGIKHFLVESVVAVMENKATIASVDSLKNALQQIASVKALDRTNKGQNYILRGDTKGPQVNPDDFDHQVFGAIITQESMTRASHKRELLDFLRSNSRRLWFNMYIDINSFSVGYVRARKPEDRSLSTAEEVFSADPSDASKLAFFDRTGSSLDSPLATLAQELVDFLRVAPLIDFSPSAYLWSETGKVDWIAI